mmetsp:Transcript_20664/g.35011  ORF Transcript_20664/g.35011 Transcript_20664/m.35011 type:complete len:491 (-) Transcript_20664:86-1558(-)
MKFTLLSLLVVFSPGLVTNVGASNVRPWTDKGKESARGTRDIRAFFANAAAQPAPAPAPTQSLESDGSESSSDDGSDSSSDEEENEPAPPPAIPSASVRVRAPRVSDSSAASLPVIHHLPPFAENESNEDEELSNGESPGRAARISLDFNDEVSSRIRTASDADLNNRVGNIIRHRGLSHDTDEEATPSVLLAAGGGLLSSEESLSSSHAPGDGLVGATIPDRGETSSSSLFQDAESGPTRSPLEQPLRDYIEYDENDDFSDVFSVPEFTDSGEINLEAGFEETSWEQIDTGNVYINPAFTLYTSNEQDRQFAGECIQFCLIWPFLYNPIINGAAYCAASIAGVLFHIIGAMQLLCVFYSRGAAASGRSWPRVRGHLMGYNYFSMLILKIEEFYRIGRGGLILNQSGKHRWHQDKFLLWNHYRAILSLLCSVKIMWFRDSTTGAQFGIRIPHGAFIVLTRFGSGAEGTICHMVTGADDSFIFVFDFGEKK